MLLLLYRYLYFTIGIAQVGIWSLVLVTMSLSNIANLGFGGSLVKFVAQYHAREDQQSINEIVGTAVITVAVTVAGIIIVLYPAIRTVFHMVVPEANVPVVDLLLPYACISLWVNAIGNLYAAVLDGYHFAHVKSKILLVNQALYLLLSMIFVGMYGSLVWLTLSFCKHCHLL